MLPVYVQAEPPNCHATGPFMGRTPPPFYGLMIGETAPAVARLQPRQVAVTATECPQDTELICNTGRLTAAPLLHLSFEPIGHVLGDRGRKRHARVGAQDCGEFRSAKYLALRQLVLGQRQAAHAELPIKIHEAIRSSMFSVQHTRKRALSDAFSALPIHLFGSAQMRQSAP
jgi:hypothetical protein